MNSRQHKKESFVLDKTNGPYYSI